MYGFSEQNFDVTNYSSVISSIAFSKCTKFFGNCLMEPSLIITKSRAKLKVILDKNCCKLFGKAQILWTIPKVLPVNLENSGNTRIAPLYIAMES